MICYKGNSFFRNIKILFKYFVKKAKIPFEDNCIFYKKTLKFYYFFCTKDKIICTKRKKSSLCFPARNTRIQNNLPHLNTTPSAFSLVENSHNSKLFYTIKTQRVYSKTE